MLNTLKQFVRTQACLLAFGAAVSATAQANHRPACTTHEVRSTQADLAAIKYFREELDLRYVGHDYDVKYDEALPSNVQRVSDDWDDFAGRLTSARHFASNYKIPVPAVGTVYVVSGYTFDFEIVILFDDSGRVFASGYKGDEDEVGSVPFDIQPSDNQDPFWEYKEVMKRARADETTPAYASSHYLVSPAKSTPSMDAFDLPSDVWTCVYWQRQGYNAPQNVTDFAALHYTPVNASEDESYVWSEILGLSPRQLIHTFIDDAVWLEEDSEARIEQAATDYVVRSHYWYPPMNLVITNMRQTALFDTQSGNLIGFYTDFTFKDMGGSRDMYPISVFTRPNGEIAAFTPEHADDYAMHNH
ncbi:MAG: hypothetical protein AB7T49_05695 [Oligoflexales bacterium]